MRSSAGHSGGGQGRAGQGPGEGSEGPGGRGGGAAMQVGLIDWTGGYLTAEGYGDAVTALGSSLGKLQVRRQSPPPPFLLHLSSGQPAWGSG